MRRASRRAGVASSGRHSSRPRCRRSLVHRPLEDLARSGPQQQIYTLVPVVLLDERETVLHVLDVGGAVSVATGRVIEAVLEQATGAALRLLAVLADQRAEVEERRGTGSDQGAQPLVRLPEAPVALGVRDDGDEPSSAKLEEAIVDSG